MSLIRWTDPRRDMVGFHDEVNRLFESLAGITRPYTQFEGTGSFLPPVDVEENAEDFVLRADLPGMSQKEIKVHVTGDNITIRGERKLERKEGLHRVERVRGTFERTFTLGAPVRSDKIQATYRDGVLEVRIPKAEEARVREIEVQVGS
jgi:HSP20 family protein